MKFEIEKNVPLPKRLGTRGRLAIYPFMEMEVGDSFSAPVAIRQRVANAANGVRKRTGRKFVTHKDGDEIRCWRTE